MLCEEMLNELIKQRLYNELRMNSGVTVRVRAFADRRGFLIEFITVWPKIRPGPARCYLIPLSSDMSPFPRR